MSNRIPTLAVVALAAILAVATTSCEDTPLIAPSDGTLSMTANPTDVSINVSGGQEDAEVIIDVIVRDSNGVPLKNVNVLFSSTGGALFSRTNACLPDTGSCFRTGGTCSSDTDCPAVSPLTYETDSTGRVTERLVVFASNAGGTIEVTATSGNLTATTQITVTRPDLPQAVIQISPPDQQQKGSQVAFNGGSSTPQGDVTCYQWTIVGTATEIVQDRISTYNKTYTDEQTLDVTLRISTDPDVGSRCNRSDPALPASDFVTGSNASYVIVCDLSDPVISASTDSPQELSAGRANVSMTGTASDPDTGITSASWDCGNNTSIDSATGTCVYMQADEYTARFTATNGCGATSSTTTTVVITSLGGP